MLSLPGECGFESRGAAFQKAGCRLNKWSRIIQNSKVVRVLLIHSPLIKPECYYIRYKGFLEWWPNRFFKCFFKKKKKSSLYINFLLHWGSDKVLAHSPVWQTAWKKGCCVQGEQPIAPRWCLLISFRQLRRTWAAKHCYPVITGNHGGVTSPRIAAQPGLSPPGSTCIPVSSPTSMALEQSQLVIMVIANPARRTLVPSFRDLASLETLVL